MTQRMKGGLLCTLLVILASLIGMRVVTSQVSLRVPLTYRSGVAPVQSKKNLLAPGQILKVTTLETAPASFTEPKNIFLLPTVGSGRRPANKATPISIPSTAGAPTLMISTPVPLTPVRPLPTPVVSPPPPSPTQVALEERRRQREAAEQQARQFLTQYRFLGFVSEDGEKRAFVGKGNVIYVVRLGDTFDTRVEVAHIDPSSLLLRDAESNVESRLTLIKGNNGL